MSWKRGTSFSMPMRVMSVSGRVRHMRPLPSDSKTETVPVSATPMLVPETATEAWRNFLRRWARAAPASSTGSSDRSAGASPMRSRKMPRTSERLRWMAGTTMWEGMSSASWTIISARSVSWAVMPAARRCSLRLVSWSPST